MSSLLELLHFPSQPLQCCDCRYGGCVLLEKVTVHPSVQQVHYCCITPEIIMFPVQGLTAGSPLLTQPAQGPHQLPSTQPRPQLLLPSSRQLLQQIPLHPQRAALQVGGTLHIASGHHVPAHLIVPL